ncbi:hypothetical protein HYU95_05980 [Candidatus Daviesbacteria bacterium]|nr:hypothetical protein [Candidatus Daviesbacteria bacterium]
MSLLISILGFALLFFVSMSSLSFAQTKNSSNTPVLEKIDPKRIASQQLHKNYTDSQHRYRLTVEGNSLNDNPTAKKRLNYSWSTDCGKFFEGGVGPSTRYLGKQSVIWGYEYPKEDCTEVLIRVTVRQLRGGERVGEVYVSQKIFYPEITPTIEPIFTDDPIKSSCSIGQRIKIFIGNAWYQLLLFGGGKSHDPRTYETPGAGKNCVRG